MRQDLAPYALDDRRAQAEDDTPNDNERKRVGVTPCSGDSSADEYRSGANHTSPLVRSQPTVGDRQELEFEHEPGNPVVIQHEPTEDRQDSVD